MDEVDRRYKDSIRRALQQGDVSRLTELIPSLSSSEASNYIEKWQRNYLETMEKIRASKDTTDLEEAASDMLYSLLDKVNLSGYHR